MLAAGEEEAAVEADAATDDVTRTAKAIAQRTKGNMAKMSGAEGVTYMEYRTGAPKRKGPVQHSKHWRAAVNKPKSVV